MAVHLSKGFYCEIRQPLDSSFSWRKEVERVGLQLGKPKGLLGMPCTGIQESRMKLFVHCNCLCDQCQLSQSTGPVGKARGRRGQSEGGSLFLWLAQGFFFQAGDKAVLFSVFQFSDVHKLRILLHICFCRQCCFSDPVKTTGLHITHSSL